MPTYEYKCDNCEHQFDIYQSMKDEKLTKCPNCGQNTLKRLIGAGGGLIFKGSGFYLTDYKIKPQESLTVKSSDKNPEKQESTVSKTEIKTETKSSPESKSESKSSEKKTAKIKSDN